MPIKFVFVRHAVAEHNAAFHEANNDPKIFFNKELRDSKLTEKGKAQAIHLAKELNTKYPNVEAIWSSSLQRCIQTADEIFEELNVNQYYIHDNLIERQTPGYEFNYRTEREQLKELYGHINMDYIPEIPALWIKSENNNVLRSRMYMMMMLLLDLFKDTYSVIIIVSHKDAILALTGKSLNNAEYFEMTEEEVRKL
jgi:broad specificity phosphatase PhoE